MTGLFVKKFRGRRRSVIGSTGMTGKSSGEGMCVTPKVCQRTMSVLVVDVLPSPIHSGIPREGSPEVWGTWRPAGQSSSSRSEKEKGQQARSIVDLGQGNLHFVTWTA